MCIMAKIILQMNIFSKAGPQVNQFPRGGKFPSIIPLVPSVPKQPTHHGITMLKGKTNEDYKQFCWVSKLSAPNKAGTD